MKSDKSSMNITEWFHIQIQMMAYLCNHRGIVTVPNSYLIRDKGTTDGFDFHTKYDTSDAVFIAYTAHHGTQNDIDNKWLVAEIYRLADGAWILHRISGHLTKFDGHSALLAMKQFAQGDANNSCVITRIKCTLAGLQYTRKGKYPFKKYTSQMLKLH
jgi:hypothetical protein